MGFLCDDGVHPESCVVNQDVPDEYGDTALISACEAGSLPIVKVCRLLKRNVARLVVCACQPSISCLSMEGLSIFSCSSSLHAARTRTSRTEQATQHYERCA